MKIRIPVSLFILFFLLSISCNFLTARPANPKTETPVSPSIAALVPTLPAKTQPTPTRAATTKSPSFGKITFCLDFDDQTGKAIDPATKFPAGIMTVYMLFDFQNMPQGQLWTLELSRDGKMMEGIEDEPWDDDENGWAAYELSEDLSNNPLAGRYTVRLFIGDRLAQENSFEVALPDIKKITFPAFGPLQFATRITDEGTPINPADTFPAGTQKVYAVFPYTSLKDGLPFSRQWLHNGKETARRDLAWDEGEEGITYGSLENKEGLAPGTYTLNLFINNQIARSASFTIEAPKPTPTTVRPPARPDQIFDSNIMPTYQYLTAFPNDSVRSVADFLLRHHVKVFVDPKYTGLAAFSYTCTEIPPKYAGDVGEIKVSSSFFKKASRVELAGVLLHETTHAIQRTQGMKCGCTVEKEYHAYSVQGGFWVMAGRGDLVTDYVGSNIFDASGRFDKNKFWQAIKKIYKNCPDY